MEIKTEFAYPPPILHSLPDTLPSQGSLCIELYEGIPVIRASFYVQERVETLLEKHQESGLSGSETEELDQYEEMDDYLSFLNRIVRNLYKFRG